MAMWNPWRGCRKCSDGCLHCYIHKGDAKKHINTNDIVKTKDFYKPIERLKNGAYKMKAGTVYLCFSTDWCYVKKKYKLKMTFSLDPASC